MKKIIISIFILLCPSLLIAKWDRPLKTYKPVYFIAGNTDDQVKCQLSFKYGLLYPFDKYGIYAGYTQLMYWRLYDKSSPFKDVNYNPELFYYKEIFKYYIDYIQIGPIEHKSNGRDGEESRGYNRGYVQIQYSIGKIINIGGNTKSFWMYNKSSKNSDINDYMGYYEQEFFIKLKKGYPSLVDKEKLYIKFGCGKEISKGWMEIGLKMRIVTSKIQPYLFFQVYHGYNQFLLDYNEKETCFRAGFLMQ